MADRKMYTREYKLEVLELARTSGKINAVLERELGLYQGQIGAWQRAFAREGQQAFPGSGHLTDNDAELQRLRREVETLRQERDILKKAVAIFSAPPSRSCSLPLSLGISTNLARALCVGYWQFPVAAFTRGSSVRRSHQGQERWLTNNLLAQYKKNLSSRVVHTVRHEFTLRLKRLKLAARVSGSRV